MSVILLDKNPKSKTTVMLDTSKINDVIEGKKTYTLEEYVEKRRKDAESNEIDITKILIAVGVAFMLVFVIELLKK